MAVELNHTIIGSRDPQAAAQFMSDMLGLAAPHQFGPFTIVEVANGVSLDHMDWGDHEIEARHFAFLVSEAEWDEIFGRITERGLPYWADPHKTAPGEINHHDGGRGVYWDSPDGHLLEIITRPYGSGV